MLGVFDSGAGGLTVVKEILALNPGISICYVGDTARVPWGNKKPDTIIHYSRQLTKFLIKKGANTIVIACHTASSVALTAVSEIVGDVQVIDMISPSVLEGLNTTRNGKIGIIGTRTTINSKSWETALLKLKSGLKIIQKSCPLFVPIVEENLEDHPGAYEFIDLYLKEIKDLGVDTLILACTHYPFLIPQIKNYMGLNISLVNPAKSVAKSLFPNIDTGELKIYLTDQTPLNNRFFMQFKGMGNVKINTLSLEEIEHE